MKSFRLNIGYVCSVALVFSVLLPCSQADVVPITVAGSGPGGDASITFPEIEFTSTINSSAPFLAVVIQGASQRGSGESWYAETTQTLTFSINGGGSYAFDSVLDGNDIQYPALYTTADTIIGSIAEPLAISIGDKITIAAGSLSLIQAEPNFIAPSSGSYEVSLIDFNANGGSGGVMASFASVIPEPSTSVLLVAGFLAILGIRNRFSI